MQQIGIGLAGMGNVGAGVFKHLTQNHALLRERLGLELVVKKIAVRDPQRARSVVAPAKLITGRWEELLDDPSIQIIVELMGQKEESLRLMLGAIERKKIVVTGNKALLAEHGQEVFQAATAHHVPVFFEAAVGGGVPIIKSIREAFVAKPHSVDPWDHQRDEQLHPDADDGAWDRLRRRAPRGAGGGLCRKADPTLDVNGGDAAHKAIILASLAYGFWVPAEKIFVEGIEQLTAGDICFARQLGYRIKLLGISRRRPAARSRCGFIRRSSRKSTCWRA
jgi:homoserine dehydrogenase